MPAKSPDSVFETSQTEVELFLENKGLEAQNTLLKGFLHEVNNALAGIGTLAEALKDNIVGVEPTSLQQNMELMANAAQKSAALQRRIRALYPTSPEESIEIDIAAFLRENKDLMELSLPYSQRMTFVIGETGKKLKTTRAQLWQIVSLMILWARESQTPKLSLEWHEGKLSISLMGETQSSLNASWAMAFKSLANPLGAKAKLEATEIEISFAA